MRKVKEQRGIEALEHDLAGDPAGGFFPPEEETRQLVERIIYQPERVKWRD